MPKAYGTPGPRAIYPDMCDSRSLARCGLMANAIFPRLIAQADDQGRLHGDAIDMAAVCFPKMPRVHKDVPKALDELAAVKAIARYEVDGEPYIQIVEWWQYQGHQRRAYPSRYPAPEGWTDKVYGRWKDDNGDLPQPAADSGDPQHTSGDLPPDMPQPAASRAGATGPVPVSPLPISPVLSAQPRGHDGLSKIDGTKKKPPEDEETVMRCQSILADPEAPTWKKDAAREQLKVMGVAA